MNNHKKFLAFATWVLAVANVIKAREELDNSFKASEYDIAVLAGMHECDMTAYEAAETYFTSKEKVFTRAQLNYKIAATGIQQINENVADLMFMVALNGERKATVITAPNCGPGEILESIKQICEYLEALKKQKLNKPGRSQT